jgi:NAD(P)-dependent dehydrogenase (short-subunit alcohol dehydrogenase family)
MVAIARALSGYVKVLLLDEPFEGLSKAMNNQTTPKSLKVLITAGASGIGLVTAQEFLKSGASVYVCDVNENALKSALADNPGLHGCVTDVSVEAQVKDLIEAAHKAMNGIDVLVNNAGIAGPTSRIEEIDLNELESTLKINVIGQFLCAKYAVPYLRQSSQASIINMSSAAGHLGMPGRSAYSASKWAVIGFTKSLAIELGKEGIRCNAVLPGAVDGPRIRAVIAAKAQIMNKPLAEVTRDYENQSALGRMVSPQDVANTILFASSPAARSINGQALAVDGHTQALS